MDHRESPGRTTTEGALLSSVGAEDWAEATAGNRASITAASVTARITARVAPTSGPPLLLLSLKLNNKSFSSLLKDPKREGLLLPSPA
jgi:hypothetical protein